jgi:very-long-chain (3R)-3-hydroxyacyl-CoA dehydratase
MSLKDSYLILYNTVCAFGWAIVWFLTVVSIVNYHYENHDRPMVNNIMNAFANVYNDPTYGAYLPLTLSIVQSAALMEIIHALFRLVRSPVLVTSMQVMSRIVALVAIYFSSQAQSKSICLLSNEKVTSKIYFD